jgi:hypothetical protein
MTSASAARIGFRLLCILLCLSVLAAIHYVTRNYFQSKDEMQTILKLKNPKTCCRVGEPIVIKAGIRNPTATPVNFVSKGGYLNNFDFIVTADQNNSVPLIGGQAALDEVGKYRGNFIRNLIGKIPNDPVGGTGIITAWPHKEAFFEIPISDYFDFSKSGIYRITCRAVPDRADYNCRESDVFEVEVKGSRKLGQKS